MDRAQNEHRFQYPLAVREIETVRQPSGAEYGGFMASEVNLRVRAEQYMYSDETREMMEPSEQVDYVRIMSRLAMAGAAFQEAYLEHQAARQEHAEFMGRFNGS